MHVVHLPFADDLRDLDLTSEAVANEVQARSLAFGIVFNCVYILCIRTNSLCMMLTHSHSIACGYGRCLQVDKAKEVITALTAPFDSNDYENPSLQRHYAYLQVHWLPLVVPKRATVFHLTRLSVMF